MDVHWLDHNVSQFDGYVWHMLSMLEHETLTALNTDTTNCWSLMVSLAPLLEARAKEGYCFPLNPVWPVLWLHRNVVWISWGKGVFDKVPKGCCLKCTTQVTFFEMLLLSVYSIVTVSEMFTRDAAYSYDDSAATDDDDDDGGAFNLQSGFL